MSDVASLAPLSATQLFPQVIARTPRTRRTQNDLFSCLVVSGCENRREMLARAAAAAGWEASACRDAGEAVLAGRRVEFRLALVDVQDADRVVFAAQGEVHELCRAWAASRRLLVVCGNQENVQEELWARQLGAWLYLPGVQGEDEVSVLCREARRVTEKMLN